jgi:hypothetical protein
MSENATTSAVKGERRLAAPRRARRIPSAKVLRPTLTKASSDPFMVSRTRQ